MIALLPVRPVAAPEPVEAVQPVLISAISRPALSADETFTRLTSTFWMSEGCEGKPLPRRRGFASCISLAFGADGTYEGFLPAGCLGGERTHGTYGYTDLPGGEFVLRFPKGGLLRGHFVDDQLQLDDMRLAPHARLSLPPRRDRPPVVSAGPLIDHLLAHPIAPLPDPDRRDKNPPTRLVFHPDATVDIHFADGRCDYTTRYGQWPYDLPNVGIDLRADPCLPGSQRQFQRGLGWYAYPGTNVMYLGDMGRYGPPPPPPAREPSDDEI